MNSYSGNGVYIAFLKPSTSSEYTFIDDINIFATSNCLTPTDIAVSEITDNTVTVRWTPRNEEDTWQVAVAPAGYDVNSVGFETVYTNPCTIAGLTENTLYDVYVKALCSNSEESAWTYPVTFKTYCSPIGEIPYNQSFDSYSNQNIQIPSCWTTLTNNLAQQTVFMTTDQAASGTTALRLNSSSEYYACAILPEFTASYNINTLQVSFKALKTSMSDGLIEVGVITNASDISTFVPIRTIDASVYSAPNVWQDFVVALNGYAGGHGRIAFRSPSIFNSSVFIDDVQVSIFSGCVAPSNLAVQAISATFLSNEQGSCHFFLQVRNFCCTFAPQMKSKFIISIIGALLTICIVSCRTQQVPLPPVVQSLLPTDTTILPTFPAEVLYVLGTKWEADSLLQQEQSIADYMEQELIRLYPEKAYKGYINKLCSVADLLLVSSAQRPTLFAPKQQEIRFLSGQSPSGTLYAALDSLSMEEELQILELTPQEQADWNALQSLIRSDQPLTKAFHRGRVCGLLKDR